MVRRVRAAVVLGVAVLLAAPAGAARAASTDQVWLRFDTVAVGQEITAPVNSGTLAGSTALSVVKDAARAGKVLSVASFTGNGNAADFPAFSATGARAIVAVRNSGATDGMNPGTARLEFGADVTLDSGTTAVAGSTDDGNNVVQRGLFNDAAQFKLQVDGLVPSCRVKGSTGAVEFSSSVTLTPNARYRLRCLRPAGSSTVTLTVTPISGSGTLGTPVARSVTAATAIGTLAFAVNVPFTAGGKLTASLALATPSTDQWNGTIDNAVLRIG